MTRRFDWHTRRQQLQAQAQAIEDRVPASSVQVLCAVCDQPVLHRRDSSTGDLPGTMPHLAPCGLPCSSSRGLFLNTLGGHGRVKQVHAATGCVRCNPRTWRVHYTVGTRQGVSAPLSEQGARQLLAQVVKDGGTGRLAQEGAPEGTQPVG